MAHGSPTLNTGNNATKKDGYRAEKCSPLRNSAGTSNKNCHKSDTTGSPHVLDKDAFSHTAVYVDMMDDAGAYFELHPYGLFQNLQNVDDQKHTEAREYAVEHGITTKHIVAFIECEFGGAA